MNKAYYMTEQGKPAIRWAHKGTAVCSLPFEWAAYWAGYAFRLADLNGHCWVPDTWQTEQWSM